MALHQPLPSLYQPPLPAPEIFQQVFPRVDSRPSPRGGSGTPEGDGELFDLTPVQREILSSLGQQSGWTSFSFQVPEQMAFSIDRLRMTWQAVAAHHPILRTVIVSSADGDPWRQKVVYLVLPMGLGSWEPLEKTVPYLTFYEASANRPVLTLHYHRALIDVKSILLLWHDFELFFHGFPFPARIPFSNYAKAIGTRNRNEAISFWNGYLDGYHGRGLLGSSDPDRKVIETRVAGDVGLLSELENFGQKHQVSVKTMLRAGWAATLSRHLETQDVAFYTNLRDCSFDQTEYIVGPMDVTTPLRVRLLEEELTLQALYRLESEKKTASRYSFLGGRTIEEHSGSTTAVQSTFIVLESEIPVDSLPQLDVPMKVTLDFATAQVSMMHDSNYPSARVRIILQHFWEVMRQIIANPYGPFMGLSLASEDERTVLLSFRSSHEQVPPQLVHTLIEKQARNDATKPALQFELSEALSFAQLNAAANRVSHQLARLVTPGSIIPIHMDVSVNFVITLLAILKAGGAYVILDPAQPPARKAYIMEDVQAPCYLTQGYLVDELPNTKAYLVEDLLQSSSNESDLCLDLDPEQPAYIIYTSGSTGVPKGVILSHRAASTGIQCAPAIEDNRNLLFYNPVFSAAQRTILSTLANGGCLCLAGRSKLQLSLTNLVNAMMVNTLGITSSTISLLDPEQVPTLQRVNLTGELADPAVVARWASYVELKNNYGLSECTQLNWGRQMGPTDQLSSRNVGRPSDTTSAYILDPDTQKLTPFLIPGELCLEGPQIASGYLNKKALTEKAFVDSPFTKGCKLYRTGDMAVRLEDGTIEIIGRIDFQTKIHGQRVEPGEISALLSREKAVRAAVVIAATIEGEKALVACISPENTMPWAQLVHNLRQATLTRLPSYMTPAYWLSFDTLPLNTNGKTDVLLLRKQVEAMQRSDLISPSLVTDQAGRPLSEVETVLQTVWAKVLRLPADVITVNQSFLDLGGDSLKALLVISELLPFNYVAELGDLLRADSLATAAASLRYEVIAQTDQEPPAPYSLIKGGPDVDPTIYEDAYHATPFQEGIISAHRSNGGYVYHRVFNIKGYEIPRLQQSFQKAIDANPIYRTSFLENGATFLQTVNRQFQLPWQMISDISIEDYVSHNTSQDMDLGQPPIRAAVVNGEILIVTMHHALFDFWSSKFLFRDAAAVYHNQPLVVRPPFNIFVRHSQRLDENVAADFWSGYLQNAAATQLTTEAAPFNALKRTIQYDLRTFTASVGVTTGALMYAAWSIILWKHTGSAEITFAITLSGRDAPIPGIQDLNGPTMTTVPIRVRLEPTMGLADVVTLVQNELWKVAKFSQVGLRRALKAAAQSSSLFDSMVNFLVKTDASPGATELEPYGERPIWDTGFNSLEVEEKADGEFELRLSGYLEPIRTGFIIEEVMQLLRTMVDNSQTRLGEVDLIAPSEALYLQHMSVPATTDARFLHDGFEAIAATDGDRVAIEFEKTEVVSYRALNSHANQLARYLVQKGVGPDTLVPLCLPKSVEMIVSILAILKAGGGFVPLDPDNPPERNNFIVSDVSATMVLTDENLRGIFDEADRAVEVVDVYNVDLSEYSDRNLELPDLEPHHLAYAIYTSGSTGLPKGVLVPHRSIAAGIESISLAESWDREWRVLQFSNYVFDVSVGDIFCTLGAGATLCMAPMESLLSDLALVINSMKVNRLFLTPTVAKLLQPADVPGVHGIYLAGEPVTPDLVDSWAPHCVVMNCYGPTEASILANAGYIPPGGNAKVIGHPLRNCVSMILEHDSLRLAPYGAVGELCLSGTQLARGYLNRPEATEKAFVFRGSERVYRTGDLARWLPDNRIECFGRKDNQVKIHGHRIELGEIEGAILKTNKVQHAIASVVEIQKRPQLVAFCVVDPGNPNGILPAEDTFETLTTVSISLTSLPPYMVPTIWIPVGTLPLLPSGKANRKKLVEWVNAMDSNELLQYSNIDAEAEFVDPVTPEEMALQSLWAFLFHKETSEISTTSTFFAHGGDSITAINLVGKCKEAGHVLTVSDVLAFPLLQEMATRMRPVNKAVPKVDDVSVPVSDEVYAILSTAGVQPSDVEVVYPAPPGVEDFLVRGAQAEQFWQCQTVRPLPEVIDFNHWIEVTTRLTARNEILRSMWLEADGRWLQVVLANPVLDLKIIHCASEADKQQHINAAWDAEFTLGTPFIRYRLLILPDGTRDLLLKIHHAMYDGTLLRIFDDEFKALAKNQPPPDTVPFRDYVSYIQATDKSKNLEFWTSLLANAPAPFPSATHSIASALTLKTTDRRVDSFAASVGVTVPIVFQTAFALLLARLSGQQDVTYDNLITGRNVDISEAQTIAGTCANFLPFRSTFSPATLIRDLLKSTQTLFWKTTENGNVSLTDIYNALGRKRDDAASQAMFLFQPFEAPPPTTNMVDKHMRWMVMALSKVRMAIDYAVYLEVSKTATGYSLKWKYDQRVFGEEQFDAVTAAYLDILEQMMEYSRSKVVSIV
ncbi:tyrocidine synthetase 1 [Aspergillus pseudocaelatus]|uniref:Tyrocidine synthetase 1 n=1 Tax=Aspergillus pseudocaelatus TaxID=1825620 RepID=A0ABQ6W0S0_9EURO|nr:tyrocidine synthetase 1 [Aspergillus pseudocaelatus]